MPKVYYEKDGKLELLKKEVVAVIGYGSQGRAQARNAHDSGVPVVVGLNPKGKSWKVAQADGLEVLPVEEAAEKGTIVHMLIPDTAQPRVYQEKIAAHLRRGKALMFSHGFNIHFHQIVPPDDVDVFMIAPKAPGDLVRRTYEEGKGVPSLVAVAQDATGRARLRALAFAKAIGSLKAGVLQTTFKEETETDLFGEQVILCGGVSALIQASFETLVEAGYQPESAYFECLHELKLIVDLIYEGGLKKMRHFCSETANYGDLTRGPRVIDGHVRETMKSILQEIQTGAFAREWIVENQVGRPVFRALMSQAEQHPVEAVGASLRKMMSWISTPSPSQKRGDSRGKDSRRR